MICVLDTSLSGSVSVIRLAKIEGWVNLMKKKLILKTNCYVDLLLLGSSCEPLECFMTMKGLILKKE